MRNELGAVDRFLFTRLTGNPNVSALVAGRVYAELAPQTQAEFPLVLFSYAGNPRNYGMIGTCDRVAADVTYLVKAVTRERSFGTAGQIASAVDLALVGAEGSIQEGGEVFLFKGVHRERLVRYVEVADGVRYCHLGGVYRLMVSGG